jgi:thioredoxin reductase (NADPH)
MYDLIIIGAGPAGLAGAREAARHGLDFLALERGHIADTITQYPIGKSLFSTPDELELAPGALHCRGDKPTREELLTHYTRFVVDAHLPIHTREPVTAITAVDGAFDVATPVSTYRSRTVLVATGINGARKRLNVPGETDERVQYRFVEAFPYALKHVLVSGDGNSAAEAVLFLEEVGAHVTFATRRAGFGPDADMNKAEIKWWVRDPLQALADAGRVTLRFRTRVLAIGERDVTLASAEHGELVIPCDAVFALLGSIPDLQLLVAAGVQIDEDGVPHYDPVSFETNVPGLYVAGHVTRERHMKGALTVTPRIVEQIAGRLALANR